MSPVEKPLAIKLADWSDWFYRNVKDQEDFRWRAMNNMANELRRLHQANETKSRRLRQKAAQINDLKSARDFRLKQQVTAERQRDVLLEALRRLAPEELTNHDEIDGCVWCGGTSPRDHLEYAGIAPSHHRKDCAWVIARKRITSIDNYLNKK